MSALPQSGQLWLNRYEIRDELGRGGFGRVYLAGDRRLDRDVAIKVLRQSDELSATDHQRFHREIAIAARLSHPNVVTVYDGGEHDGLSYLVMRYVEGDDLRSELRRGPLPIRRVASVIGQVASALDYAHGLGLVHRDVKPGNILCEVDAERVYLADFGISRAVEQSTEERLTQAGLGPATFYYAAPEQLRTDERVDARTDVYALGCVLYECLTGQRPFEGTIGSVIGAHLHEPPPRPSVIRPDISPRFDDVVATAMAKSPEQRYPRCGDLATVVAELAAATRDTRGTATVSDERALAHTRARRASRSDAPRRADTPRTAGPPSPRPVTARQPGSAQPGIAQSAAPAPQQPTVARSQQPAAIAQRGHADPPRFRQTEMRPAGPPQRRRDRLPRRGRRWLLALAILGVLAALTLWTYLDSGLRSALGFGGQAVDGQGGQDGDSELDDEQVALLTELGVFSAGDCRDVVREPFDGVRTAVSCGSDRQTPTRVVYRRFDDEGARDAAFDQLSAGRPTTGDCRAGPNVRHPYRNEVGEGRVLCTVANGGAGVMWTVPGTPLAGNALLEDTDTLDDLYTWWDDLVRRRPGDRLPDCPQDDGLIDRGAIAAVQCELTGGVATVASNAQFANIEQMDAWYDQVVTDARERRLDRMRSGNGPRACAGLGVGDRRLVGAEVPWSIDGGEGRLLCFTNESDQNALFWTNTATAVGSIAVSPAADSRLGEFVDEWARSPYRVAE